MTLITWLALLWLLVAVSFILVGMFLTRRRVPAIASLAPIDCPRCHGPLEEDACFCGGCGRRVRHQDRIYVETRRKR